MGQGIEALARFVADTRWDDVPADVQQHVKLVLLDTLGVILAGGERPEVRALRERLAPTAGTGATVYARGWPIQDPRTAGLLNGIAGRAIELCEGLRLVSGQAAMQVLPGVLAMGEHAQASGREILTAFVAGYDVAARLCTAFTPRPLAHQNGQAPLIAAVAAGARLRGLDAAGISLAMRIATTLLLTPSYTNAVAGATTLNVAGGMSGFVAALAPELALAGFEAQPDAIEESLGKLVGAGFNPDGLLDGLGTRWESCATTSVSTRAAIRFIRRSMRCRRRCRHCVPRPKTSSASRSRRIVSHPSCVIPIRLTISARGIRSRTRRQRWS